LLDRRRQANHIVEFRSISFRLIEPPINDDSADQSPG
jgi:hypothetical protein